MDIDVSVVTKQLKRIADALEKPKRRCSRAEAKMIAERAAWDLSGEMGELTLRGLMRVIDAARGVSP